MAFVDDPLATDRLAISGTYPSTTAGLFDTVDKFYAETTADTEVQGKLAKLKVTSEELTTTKASIEVLKKARAAYKKESGESENATKVKDAAFAKMEKWMRKFYRVADIAMEDQPQLLEALDKKVKS